MRTLFLFGTLVTAVLVPWSSIAPPWGGDAAGSTSTVLSGLRSRPLVAQLATSILPLAPESEDAAAVGGEQASVGDTYRPNTGGTQPDIFAAHAAGQLPPGVHCENGVCTIVDSTVARLPQDQQELPDSVGGGQHAASDTTVRQKLTWPQAQERLRRLGVTQFRLETGLERGQFRFSCSRPPADLNGVPEQFQATAATDLDAVAQVLAQLEPSP